ncbi:MAG: aminoacyl-tRNA hydrolase [Oligoflexia bacterium]|nr:aminoacyl-tRNA hydrolase [Oligoflexia bacterium]
MVALDADSPQPWLRADVKQVLVYRRDLKMRKGKIAAQCAHAALAVFLHRDTGTADRMDVPMNGPMAWWLRHSMAKIVLSVDDESALLRVHELARDAGLPTAVITDAGRTEFHGQPTRTAVAVGPALSTEIDEITGPQGQVQTRLA